ncbi:hypothetical protein [Methanocella sp. MCL-LM]|uniref:hypothetical protein n=1 Tax=Methanocella sp. MCL-LM TaxID=3412035 RepID=UPI003C715E25
MDKTGVLILLLIVSLVASAVPAGAFIGTGISMNKQIGDTINFNLGKRVGAAGTALGIADMDLGVTWGVNYDLASMAGYPYGYGGVGAVTAGDVGYTLGLSMDETHGAAFDGAAFGVPLAEQSLTSTRFNNIIANNNHFENTQVALPFSGFPVL